MTPIDVIRRWEDSGGSWRVVATRGDEVTVSLRTCTGGEEVDRLISADPTFLAYLGGREASDDPLT